MVFLPLTRQEARSLQRDGRTTRELVAHAATPALLAAHDLDESTLEDAEYAALVYAGVASLAMTGTADELRLVVAAELPAGQLSADPDDPYGRVQVLDVRWTDVRALFSDEQAAGPQVALARAAAAGRSVSQALTLPAVEAVTDDHDLLWFAPEELDRLP